MRSTAARLTFLLLLLVGAMLAVAQPLTEEEEQLRRELDYRDVYGYEVLTAAERETLEQLQVRYLENEAALQPSTDAENQGALFDTVIRDFKRATEAQGSVIRGFIYGLFWVLVALDQAWFAIQVALKQEDFGAWVAGFVRRVVTVGFLWWLLINSHSYLQIIVDSLRQIGALGVGGLNGEGGTLSPADAVSRGVKLFLDVAKSIGYHPATWSFLFFAVLMLGLWVGVACLMLLTLIEIQFVIAFGVIVMALAGTEYTWVWAFNVYKYAITAGLKLLILQMVMFIGESVLTDIIGTGGADGKLGLAEAAGITAVSLILFVMAKDLPRTFEGLIAGGFAPGGQSAAGQSLTPTAIMAMAYAASKKAVSAPGQVVGKGAAAAQFVGAAAMGAKAAGFGAEATGIKRAAALGAGMALAVGKAMLHPQTRGGSLTDRMTRDSQSAKVGPDESKGGAK